ncbi:MAG TPA: MFS transporter [Syntrophomonadaceae bacterium]|nr:MFS transporter [Syntrophomonadaceae bacterium]
MAITDDKKHMAILFMSIFLVGMGFSIIMPVLPYYAKSMGASAFQLGMLMTVYAICQFIFTPIWGAYSDKVGRKPVLLAGIIGFSLTFILFGFATQLWMLYVIRIAGGIMACATMPTAMAYVGDSSSLEDRGSAMGLIGAAMGMGMVFGPAIGGLLSEISLAFPFVFAGLLAMGNAVSVVFLLPESLPVEERLERQTERASLLEGLRTPLAVLFLCTCLASLGESMHHGTFALFAQAKLAFTARDIGWSFTTAGIVMALVQGLVVGRMINYFGEEKTAATGITIMGFSFVLFLFMFNIPSSIAFMAVFSAGVGLIRPSISAAISKRTLVGQGEAMGVLGAFDSLGRMIGPALGGLMLDRGLNLGYYTAIIVCVLALLTLIIGTRILSSRVLGE